MDVLKKERLKKILLVDDARLFLEMEKTFLNRKNYRIFTATSGEEAIRIHRKEKVDLILLDFYMPGMRGDEVCRKIRCDDELKNVSIIMVTSSSRREDVEVCQLSGANDYITKPLNPKELIRKMTRLLNIPKRKEERVLVKVCIEGKDHYFTFFGNTVDISMTGMLMETEDGVEVDKGESLMLFLPLPNRENLLRLKGRVVREAKKIPEGIARYGLQFMDLGWKERGLLKELIERA